ncbi:response regulator transcription factor [Streptococcus sp. SGI.013]|uniref:response regulator transcription factor n=1 Tax=unclassified Streptococcus TaxID=2608887 RepID=UPI003D0018A8
MGKRILVVDDEESILMLVNYHLNKEGYQVDTAEDGKTALQLALSVDYDFIVLDLMLPGLDGMEICRKIRQTDTVTPILILSAKGEEMDKITALDLGADDYMIKPFSPRELVARIKAVLRRSSKVEESLEEKEEVLKEGDLTLYIDRHEVYRLHQAIKLTPKEYELLHYLIKNKGLTISRERLLEKVWGFDVGQETRLVDVHIGKLREKVEENVKEPRYIQTIRGYGYKFVGNLDEK